MPAETIHGNDAPIDVKISWGAGLAYIQVATINDAKPDEAAHATFSDRSAVNRMIAVLRRARDHAFGKDE